MGAALLGPVGGLVRLPGSSRLQVAAPARNVTRTALSGRVTAQRMPRGRRVWDIGVGAVKPEEYALLDQLDAGLLGHGPFIFYDELAQVTNLLTPVQSTLESGTWTGGAQGGGGIASDGTRYLRSLTTVSGSFSLAEGVPVPPDTAVTVSAYLNRWLSSTPQLLVEQYDAAGALVGAELFDGSVVPGSRVVGSLVTNPLTATLNIFTQNATMLTMPAVTLTRTVQPWATGRGCQQAVLNMGAEEALLAFETPADWGRRSSYTMTVHELA